MHISETRIRNFRNFQRARFSFTKGVNTLIGENGSGKTNTLYALRLLLDENLSRNATHLRDSDFNRALPIWQGHWIIIAVDFADLDPSEGCQLLKHSAGHMDGTDTGTFSFVFRPKQEVRRCLFDMTAARAQTDDFDAYLRGLTTDDYEHTYTGRGQADFLNNDVYRRFAGDFDTYEFPDPEADDLALLGVRITSPLHAEITCTFAQALRDAVSDLRGYRGNPLLALLRGVESALGPADVARLTERVTALNSDISSLPQIKQIATGIQTKLYDTVGHTFSPSVGIASMLPDQVEKLLQKLALRVGDVSEGDYRGDLSELSLGGANLIYLALKLLEYETKLSTDRVAHFLLIEEPEAHIHAHVQKTLFDNLAGDKTQVILTTHSTHISSVSAVSSVNILSRRGATAEVYQPSNGLTPKAIDRLERYLDAVRSTLLFAKGAILVEGEAELVMLPALIRSVLGISVDELGVSVVAMSSAFFEPVAALFDVDRIRRRCAIVTDSDAPFVELPTNSDDDNREQAHARASAKAGEDRRVALEQFVGESPWRRAFFCDHTFEVDFVSDNRRVVFEALGDIFQRDEARNRSRDRLESDLAEAGTEVLRLADKVGKGWFALLLSAHLAADSVVPRYMLDALAFASQDNVNDTILKRMALNRMSSDRFDEDLRARLDEQEGMVDLPPTDFCRMFREVAPADQLSVFMNCLEACQET